MAYPDTITLTINAIAKVLPKINEGGYSSEYYLREALSNIRLNVRHTDYTAKGSPVKTLRHNVEIIETTYPVAPATRPVVRKTYLVLEHEEPELTTTTLNFALGAVGFFTSPNLTKLINKES